MEIQELKSTNKILLEMGVTTTNSWNTEEEKKYFLTRLFEYSIVNDFSYEFAKKIGLSKKMYYDFLVEYNNNLPREARHEIKKDENKIIVVLTPKTYANIFFDKLLKVDTIDEIVNLFRESRLNDREIVARVYRYKFMYSKENFDKIFSNLSLYINHLNEKRKEMLNSQNTNRRNINMKYERKTPEQKQAIIENEKKLADRMKKNKDFAIKVVTEFVSADDYYLKPILNNNDITNHEFKRYLEIVMHEDKNLYDKFIRKYAKIANYLNDILKQHGSDSKNFDIIDYLNITDINPDDLVNTVNKNGYVYVKKFYRKYLFAFRDETNFRNGVMTSSMIFNPQYDSNGKYIEGSGKIINDEEKEKIMKYIENHNYYKSQLVYATVARKYVKGLIDIEEGKKLVKDSK